MANKQFIATVQKLGDAFGRNIGVLDDNAAVIASNDPSLLNTTRVGLTVSRDGSPLVHGGYVYMHIEGTKNSVVFVEGDSEKAVKDCSAIAICLSTVMQGSDDKEDLTLFVKHVVTDNIMPSDIYVKARELAFPSDIRTAALVVRAEQATDSMAILDILEQLFPDRNKDFIFTANEVDTVVVKTVESEMETEALSHLAASIYDLFANTHNIKVTVGIGNTVVGVKDMATSFREARTALEVGKVFDTEHTVVAYNHLGIARLIYQLPTTICSQFLNEVFSNGSIETLDQETLFTIQRFFDNNLNVSETSRGLFVHRNTLVYRLEKIKKLTGLDLREFDQAIVFKVALMVRKYVDSLKNDNKIF